MERYIKFLIIIGIVASPVSLTYANSVSKQTDLLLQRVQSLQEQVDVLNTSKNKLLSLSSVTYDNKVALKRHKKEILKLKQCGNGNDFYDGGEDFDTITYTGNREHFFITQHLDGSYTFKDLVPCGSDTDTVINIEQFVFNDGTYTVDSLKPDKIITTSKASIKLTSPKKNKTEFTLGEDIKISWQVKNAPENSQVIYKLTQLTSDGSGTLGGGGGQTEELKEGSNKGLKVWNTGKIGYLDRSGTYRVDAMLRECAPNGCMNNADFPGREQDVVLYATADPIVINIQQKNSITDNQNSIITGRATLTARYVEPFTVEISGTYNDRNICESGAQYVLDFGYGTKKTFISNSCKQQKFSFTETFSPPNRSISLSFYAPSDLNNMTYHVQSAILLYISTSGNIGVSRNDPSTWKKG